MKYSIKIIVLPFCFILLFLSSCSKEKDETIQPSNNHSSNSAPTAVLFNNAPNNGATNVGSPVTITWFTSIDIDGDDITYDVYLGTNSSNITLVSSSQNGLSYTSSTLNLGSTYYFRVDAKSGVHNSPSETRNFTSSTTGSFLDVRDNHTYGTILMGSQVWMTENLVYNSAGSYSYNNDVNNDATYGKLYEWLSVPAAIPAGWHLPTDAEWQTLETFLGMPTGDLNINNYNTSRGTDQGTQLKVGGSSGLDFPLAGFRSGTTYSALNNRTYLWVNTDAGGGNIFRRRLVTSDPSCYRFTNPYAGYAISVRLVKD